MKIGKNIRKKMEKKKEKKRGNKQRKTIGRKDSEENREKVGKKIVK